MAAYLLVDVEVIDPVAYEEYRRHVPAIIAAHGGRYLVRGGKTEVLEGSAIPHRLVVLEFPAMERLKAFYASPEYETFKRLRLAACRSNMVAVEGL